MGSGFGKLGVRSRKGGKRGSWGQGRGRKAESGEQRAGCKESVEP